ncbi:unnamed protein product [Chrysoparadoxa australica]
MPEDEAQQLEERLARLETLVFGAGQGTTLSSGGAPLHGPIGALEKRVGELQQQHCPELVQLDKLAVELATLLQPHPDVADTSIAVKETLLLASADTISTAISLLTQVSALRGHVNPPYLQDLPKHQTALEGLEGTHLKQGAAAAGIHVKLEEMLDAYDKAITLMSKKCALWSELLDVAEA